MKRMHNSFYCIEREVKSAIIKKTSLHIMRAAYGPGIVLFKLGLANLGELESQTQAKLASQACSIYIFFNSSS